MLDVITKKEYFAWFEQGIVDKNNHSLKGIQDGYILSFLDKAQGQKIAEIGGGNSRVLQKIKTTNECWNIDKFEALGNGPTDIKQADGIKIIRQYLGKFDKKIPANYFDVVFSVSVVEHVETLLLEDFFKDCYRILKPNGEMIHAVDLYVGESPLQGNSRVENYIEAITKAGFKWDTTPQVNKDLVFKPHFASNSDATMGIWNKAVPSLRALREENQSITLKVRVTK